MGKRLADSIGWKVAMVLLGFWGVVGVGIGSWALGAGNAATGYTTTVAPTLNSLTEDVKALNTFKTTVEATRFTQAQANEMKTEILDKLEGISTRLTRIETLLVREKSGPSPTE